METSQKVSIVKQDKVTVDKPAKQQQPHKSFEQKRSPNVSVTQKKENKSNKPQVQKKSQEEIKAEMQSMIDKQNAEMLKLLEDEQDAENKREDRFSNATLDEKKRLEREFGL